MSETKQDDGLISVFVDGAEVRCPPGTNMIDAAAMAGREVPHYCYHPKLSVSGNCRMCLVQLGLPGRDRESGKPMLDADGKPIISWFPGPAIACGTKASPGMHIRTDTDMVRECREGKLAPEVAGRSAFGWIQHARYGNVGGLLIQYRAMKFG